MSKYTIFMGIVLSSLCLYVSGQVRFQSVGLINLESQSQLFKVRVNSLYQSPILGRISITVSNEYDNSLVVNIEVPDAKILPGLSIMENYFLNANKTFFNNKASMALQNSGQFIPGEYRICYNFIPEDKSMPIGDELCVTGSIYSRVELHLISPLDKICEKKPSFLWSGKSFSRSSVYQLTCVTVKPTQSAVEALNNNNALIKLDLPSVRFQTNFPVGSFALSVGNKYAWIIDEYMDGQKINSSEIGEFSISCDDNTNTQPVSYADFKSYYTGKQYIFEDQILFSFTNRYATKKLDYSIISLDDNKKISSLPVVNVATGLNLITIDINSMKEIKKGKLYRLEAYNLNSNVEYFNFKLEEN